MCCGPLAGAPLVVCAADAASLMAAPDASSCGAVEGLR
jgi:hypothetical protein